MAPRNNTEATVLSRRSLFSAKKFDLGHTTFGFLTIWSRFPPRPLCWLEPSSTMEGTRCTMYGLGSENPPPDTREAKPAAEVEDPDMLTMCEPAEAQAEGHREMAMPHLYLTPSVETPGVVAEWEQAEAQGLAQLHSSPLQNRQDIEHLVVTPDDGPVEAGLFRRKGRTALPGSLYLNLEVLQLQPGVEEECAGPFPHEPADARETLGRPLDIRQWRAEVVTPGTGPVKVALLGGTRPATAVGPGAEFSQSPAYIMANFFFFYFFPTLV